MNLLIDECLPQALRRDLSEHYVRTVPQMGWNGLKNGKLLDKAQHQFDVLITIDGSLKHQQNLSRFATGIIVLSAPTNKIEHVRPLVPVIKQVLLKIQPSDLYEVK